jgi:cytochrome bd ubiquinol oxidase subunit II
METFWFIAVALMLAVYIVLDGFDFGTGIIYMFVAKTDEERRLMLHAIGPVWNGNEVWLIAGGGLLFFAFPKAYASGFSGFYLALILVLWLLMLRGLAIELRSHLDHPLWRPMWDVTFSLASLLLAVVFGAALGNLVRGVPLDAEGYFFTPLWTSVLPGPEPGILDLYTVSTGILGATVLGIHGAYYIAMKTEGDLHQRAHRFAKMGGWALIPIILLNLRALSDVQPDLSANYASYPLGYTIPIIAAVALGLMLFFGQKNQDSAAFFSSCLFILAGIGITAWGYYPNLLISSTNQSYNLTIFNSATTPYGLQVGLIWFGIGFPLVVAYTIFVYKSFWGKVTPSSLHESH